MTAILEDLVHHQLWADTQLWDAIAAHPPARDDRAVRDRFHHIHQVQQFFTWAIGVRPEQPAMTKPGDFASFEDLHQYSRQAHEDVRRIFAAMSDARHAESIVIPWFTDPPLRITAAEALVQMTMHSLYHRGQNAARLRELGGEPPITDFIFWLWKGKPAVESR